MSGSIPSSYELDGEAISEIVAMSMSDADFLRRTDGLVRPEYFTDEVDSGLVRLTLGYWEKYRDAPSNAAWAELIKDAFKAKPALWRDDKQADVVARFRELRTLSVRSKAFLLDKIAEFAQEQAIVGSLISSSTLLGKRGDEDRFEKIRGLLTKAMKVGLHEGDEDYDYFAEIKARTDERLLVASGGLPKTGVTTGIKELDGLLMHGGWGRGEMSLFMGPPKSGKSFFLVGCAADAVRAGHNVLLVTLENSTQIQAQRIDAILSDVSLTDFSKSPHTVHGMVETVGKSARIGKLHIRQFPTGTFKPKDLERLLEEYQTKGICFDIIIVDYMDIMAPDSPKDSERDASKEIYTRCRGIVGAYMGPRGKAALLSATATNREGAKAAVAHVTHIAEDINRARLADLLISINRTESEKAEGKVRLNITAARNSRDGVTIFIKSDLDKARACAAVESVE